jgi:membrane dipeptidase
MISRHALVALLLPIALLAAACGQAPSEPDTTTPADPAIQARGLAQNLLLVDTHIDLPYRLHEAMEDVTVRTDGGHFDAIRAAEGGLDAAFMSIYIPASYQDEGGARELADELIDLVEGLANDAPGTFAVARSVADVRANFEADLLSLPMGIENGGAIEDDLGLLQHFYDRGVRYMTLAHSEPNLICDSSYSEDRRWNGLSPFGREVVAEMNRLGLMVDISHVTDNTFDQVLDLTSAPVIASHSNCRAFTPGFERNMSDEMIVALAENGGVIQIAFAPGFLTAEAREQSMKLWATMRLFMRDHNVAMGSPEFRDEIARFYEEHPKVVTTVSDVADHIDHVVGLVGVDHVGLGSDFDGISEGPQGLEDVSTFPNLLAELLGRGYTEEDLRKICGENLLRVWSEVERVAAESRQPAD